MNAVPRIRLTVRCLMGGIALAQYRMPLTPEVPALLVVLLPRHRFDPAGIPPARERGSGRTRTWNA
jgi:hypothetical protein